MSTAVPTQRRLRVAADERPLPPYDLGAEAAVLSACFLQADAIRVVRGILPPEHCYADAHRRILEAIYALDDANQAIDLVTVASRLRDTNRLEQVGGTPYLAAISDETPAVANVATHARLVTECARRRREMDAANTYLVALRTGDVAAAGAAWRELEGVRAPVVRQASTPAQVVASWRDAGPLARVPTGIGPLDDLCRGGLPVPWRVMVVGAPSAGKTALAVVAAWNLARQGVRVGVLAVDEEPDDVTVRLGQMLGCSVAALELRDTLVLDELERALCDAGVRLYDPSWTVESAAADLAAWARAEGALAALVVDSVQTARAQACAAASTAREHVEAVVAAVRDVSTRHRLLVLATSEANRASYRSEEGRRDANDLAAGAESRAVEYGAQTQLVLRTPRDHAEVVQVCVAKNRRAYVGEFWLRLDRDRHSLTACAAPDADEGARADRRREQATARVAADASVVAELLASHAEGLGQRDLRAALRAAGHAWAHGRLDAALAVLEQAGRVGRSPHGRSVRVRLCPHDPLEDV